MRRITAVAAVLTGGAILALTPGLVQASTRTAPHVCKGTFKHAGVLKGKYPNGVVVKGVCEVNSGPAHVIGTLTVAQGGTLAAAFGLDHSALTITGNLVVDQGAAAVLGCKVNADGSGSACTDDPNMNHPTLRSHTLVTGSVTEHAPLGVIVHNTKIGGNLTQTGGGGGASCAPVKGNPVFGFGVFSDYEDTWIGGNTVIKDLKSCWLGFGRDYTPGSVTVASNEMADPDAIEIFSNYISKNLSCSGNSHPAGMPPDDKPVWDSSEAARTGIYPRNPQPNTVEGTRSGQCVKATPTTQGGASGGLF